MLYKILKNSKENLYCEKCDYYSKRKSQFERQIVKPLLDKTIKFLAVNELTWIIDAWDNTSLGDFDISNKQFYSVIVKGAANGN